MDTIPGNDPMENPPHPPLAGLDPVDLLKQGAAADTFLEDISSFHPQPIEELAPLFPQFEILSLIGKGGMGAVYKVRQKELDRIVALKILPPAIGDTPGFSERFTREAKALAKLNHPGIVTIHEFGQREGLYFILMEFVDGVNLARLMQTGRISPREALAIVPQICDALQFAHDQGIIHRDIKPENILLDRLGRVKVADFGIAKIVATVSDDGGLIIRSGNIPVPTEQTLAGKILGTPQYMAPEQIEHPGDVDHRADIYALGVVFYQMLTGELPGKCLEAPSKKAHIDARLDEMVLRALEKEPESRYQTAIAMKFRIEEVTKDIVRPECKPSPFRSKKIKWIVAAGVGAAALWLALKNSGQFYPASSRSSAYKAPVVGRINFKFTHPESQGGTAVSYDVKKWGDTQWSPNSGITIILKGGQWLLVKSRVNAMRPDSPVAMVTTSSDNSHWETKELDIHGKVPLRQLAFSNGLRVEIVWSPASLSAGNSEPPDRIQQEVMRRASRHSDEKHPTGHPEEALLDLEIAVHVARKMYLPTEPAFRQAALVFDGFARANPTARSAKYDEALDHRKNLLVTRSKELAAQYGPQHPEVAGNRRELEAVEQIIRTRRYLVVRTPDVSQSGQTKFHFDCAGDTMQKLLSRLGKQFDVRICWEYDEKIFANRTEPVMSKDLLEELEIGEASGRLSEREKERLVELRRFPEVGGGEVFTRYQGELAASSLDGLLDQLTKNTTDRARKSKSGKTWMVSPIEASRLEFPVTMNTRDLTIEQAVDQLCSQSPEKLQRSSFGPRPWLDMVCKPVSFDHEPAWEVLCRISEDAEFDLIWEAIPDLVINPSHNSVDGFFAHAAKVAEVGSIHKSLQIQDSRDAAAEFLSLLVEVGLAKARGMENSDPSMIEMESKVNSSKIVIKERMLLTPDITIAKVASGRLSECKKKQAALHDSGLNSLDPAMKRLNEEMDVLSKIIAGDDKLKE